MDRNNQRYVLSIKNGIQKHFKTSLSSEAKKQYLRRYIYAYLCIFFIHPKFSQILLLFQTQGSATVF